MGWQGRVRRLAERKRVAKHLGVHWTEVEVWCWRANQCYWVTLATGQQMRVDRKTLAPRPLGRW